MPMTGNRFLQLPTVLLLCAGSMLACGGMRGGARPQVYYEDHLKARAAFDFNCPEDQLTVTTLGDRNTAGVEGCGKRATYYNDNNDQWVLNTASGTPEAAPPPAPAAAPLDASTSQPVPAAGSATQTP
jgi:hypothetical protein